MRLGAGPQAHRGWLWLRLCPRKRRLQQARRKESSPQAPLGAQGFHWGEQGYAAPNKARAFAMPELAGSSTDIVLSVNLQP